MRKTNKKDTLNRLNQYLIIALPVVIFFTNFPLIKIGETSSMHLEVSLPEIWLVLFSLASLINIEKLIKFYKPKKLILASLFPLYALLSVIWSDNPLRAILTAGLICLVVFAILNLIYLLRSLNEKHKQKLIRTFLITSIAVSSFCWLQNILDLLGVSRNYSLMCAGCTYHAFGFPHPNGFAIEPQFMGGLLIAPSILSLYLAFNKNKIQRKYLALACFFMTTLFLTFSRGAIYAFLVAAAFFIVASVIATKNKKTLLIIPAAILTFVVSLSLQGLMAAVSPTSDSFISGMTKSIHHLSLGHIDLRANNSSAEPPNDKKSSTTETKEAVSEPQPIMKPNKNSEITPGKNPTEEKKTSSYSGYVSESTDIRVNLTNLALKAAAKGPATLIFGSGIGSAGTVLNREFPEKIGTPKQIVQNEYASLLLELGIVGILLAALTATTILTMFGHIKVFITKSPYICVGAIIIGYMATLFFFSGLPNAFHIYLLPPLLLLLIGTRRPKPI